MIERRRPRCNPSFHNRATLATPPLQPLHSKVRATLDTAAQPTSPKNASVFQREAATKVHCIAMRLRQPARGDGRATLVGRVDRMVGLGWEPSGEGGEGRRAAERGDDGGPPVCPEVVTPAEWVGQPHARIGGPGPEGKEAEGEGDGTRHRGT